MMVRACCWSPPPQPEMSAFLPSSNRLLPWTRFWSPRKTRIHGTSSEFFEDPHGLFGKHLHSQATTLSEITPETGLLVLCGEPGLGKTTELEVLCERLTASSGGKERLIQLKAREFESFQDLQGHIDGHPAWQAWLPDGDVLTILLDGLDEGLIRMPTLVARLRSYLESRPTERLRLILSCRSFEWPEAEGGQLASLWKREEKSGFVFELEPLRREDARLAAAQREHDGDKFLEAVYRSDVASLASRPITLFFLLDEFGGDEFQATSRRQLYKNGCRRLCDENKINPQRAQLLRRFPREECTTDEKFDAASKLACGLLLGGKNALWLPSSSDTSFTIGNACDVTELLDTGLMRGSEAEQTLGSGLFTALGRNCFGFTHQTFAECLAGQTLAQLPLPQLRTLLCATDPASGNEYVVPQLVELAAWVAGDHAGFFSHLIDIDPAALLRSGMAFAEPAEKARLVERLLDLADKNQFFDETEYWRFWRDLDHPGLPDQLIEALTNPQRHAMVQRVAIDIAEACRRPELVPTLFAILKAQNGGQYFRSSVADALCASMPDDRLAELEPLARGEVGPDPDQSILGHALQRLVPAHWSVSDALPFIGPAKDPVWGGSYWQALEELPKHLQDRDILLGLRIIREWDGGFSSTSFRRKLCMALLSQGLENIDDPAICDALMKLWKVKRRNFREFFRIGDPEDADFVMMNDESRRKWIAATVNASVSGDRIDSLSGDTYRLIKPEDFGWMLKNLLDADETIAPAWANAVQRLLWNEEIRVTWWDEFIDAFRRSPALRSQMVWFEESTLDSPARRKAKAWWLWHERRPEKLMKRRREREKRPDPRIEIERTLSRIAAGDSWEFINLCQALSRNDEELYYVHLRHDITAYPGWNTISDEQKELVRKAALNFLLERSDGWDKRGARTNYSDPGVVAVWLLRQEVMLEESLRTAVGTKWIEAIIGTWDSSSDDAKELFALAYRINPARTIHGWIREMRRDSEQHGHPFAIRRAATCFDATLAKELIDLLKTLKDPISVRMAIHELKKLDERLAGEVAAYLLAREVRVRKFNERMVGALIIAGLGTGSRIVWRLAYSVLSSRSMLAKQVMLSVACDADLRNGDLFRELTENEIGDFYLLLCSLCPHSENPEERSPERAIIHFRSGTLNALSGRSTLAAYSQLRRLVAALPDQTTWLLHRAQQTLSSIRRNEWQSLPLPELAAILANDRKRIIRDNGDLMHLVLESLEGLQRHLKDTTLPAVEDLWHWDDAGLRRKNFRHKVEEAVSDYIARWLRDRIGPQSGVVVNREVQPVRGKRTDVLVEAWSGSPVGRNRQEVPLSVTIEVKGCWNSEIKTGAENQLRDGYLRPFRRTHGIFLVAWFYSPGSAKSEAVQPTELKFDNLSDAKRAVAGFVEPAHAEGFEIRPFVLDCRLP